MTPEEYEAWVDDPERERWIAQRHYDVRGPYDQFPLTILHLLDPWYRWADEFLADMQRFPEMTAVLPVSITGNGAAEVINPDRIVTATTLEEVVLTIMARFPDVIECSSSEFPRVAFFTGTRLLDAMLCPRSEACCGARPIWCGRPWEAAGGVPFSSRPRAAVLYMTPNVELPHFALRRPVALPVPADSGIVGVLRSLGLFDPH